jgi:prepilin-type N-terminal cleavage/methylation domain-containing protein
MKRGFSLIELSIVLVILGLLTGGILAGRSLIRASELRAVVTELQRYTTATNAFSDKYFSVPGDFRDATRFWGRYGTTDCDTNWSAAISPTGGCDGNGDGIMGWCRSSQQTCEPQQYWRHLQLAGLIEGQYTGFSEPPYTTIAVDRGGVNVPKSKLTNAIWGLAPITTGGGVVPFPTVKERNGLTIGAEDFSWGVGAVFTPSEAWNIDVKLDDGKPAIGKVTSYDHASCVNQLGTNNMDSTYKLDSSAISCYLLFPKPWR